MKNSPEDEGDACAVPESAKKHGDHQVHISPGRAFPVSSQRDVKVVPEEAGKCHVPAPPEVDDACGLVGGVEIEGEFQPEQVGDADGHVGIAGEIEIDLEGVCQRPDPCLAHGEGAGALRRELEDGRGGFRKVVRDDYFFEKAHCKHSEADGKTSGTEAGDLRFELGDEFPVVDKWAGDEMGEKGNEENVVPEAVAGLVTAIYIHEESDLEEGEKGYRERHHQYGNLGGIAGGSVRPNGKDPEVFVIKE